MEFNMSLKTSVDDNTEETFMELTMDTPQGTQTYEYCGDSFSETLNDLYEDILCDLIEMSKKKKEEETLEIPKPDLKEYEDLVTEIDALTAKINDYIKQVEAYKKYKEQQNKKKKTSLIDELLDYYNHSPYSQSDLEKLYKLIYG